MARGQAIGVGRALLAAATAVLTTGCSSSSDSGSSAVGSGTIGAAGGSIRVTAGALAGTSIEVAAGVLTADLTITIYATSATGRVEVDIVGPAAQFSPTDHQLAQAAVFTLPFDPAALPAGTVASDLRVTARSGNGQDFTPITPSAVDTSAGIVTFSASQLANFWVTAPTAYRMERYFVLGDGNRYEYEGNNALEVSSTDSEPSFEGRQVWKVHFLQPFFARNGVYLEEDSSTGALLFLGQFDVPLSLPAVQEIAATPFDLFLPTERVGNRRTDPYDYTAFEVNLPNPPTQIYTGDGTVRVEVVEERSVDTPVGRFDKCLLVEFDGSFADTRPSTGTGRTRLWLAPDVGPVMVQRNDDQPQALVQAIVNGQVIRSQ